MWNTLPCVIPHVRLRFPLCLQFYSVHRLKCDLSVGTAVRWQHFNSSSMQPVCSQCLGILSSCRVILFSDRRPSTWMSVDIRLLQDRCVLLLVFGDLLFGAAVHIRVIVISQLFCKMYDPLSQMINGVLVLKSCERFVIIWRFVNATAYGICSLWQDIWFLFWLWVMLVSLSEALHESDVVWCKSNWGTAVTWNTRAMYDFRDCLHHFQIVGQHLEVPSNL